jgi:ParB family transcriptional regulator, chromosome partitioning protein
MSEDSLIDNRQRARSGSRRALGRGLDALLPASENAGQREVDVDNIEPNPNQPRQRFDNSALEELAASITEHGIVQPLVVTAVGDDRFRLIVGERRWKAAKLAGLSRVPVVVKDAGDRQALELALIENLQRADLNPFEEAAAYQRLIQDFELTQQQVANQVGKSRVAIANTLRLLALPETLKRAVVEERISEGHARALLPVPDRNLQLALLDRIEREGWNVRQTEERVRRLLHSPADRPAAKKSPDIEAVERELRNSLGAKVSLRHGKRGGRIVIEYASSEEFEELYRRLTRPG